MSDEDDEKNMTEGERIARQINADAEKERERHEATMQRIESDKRLFIKTKFDDLIAAMKLVGVSEIHFDRDCCIDARETDTKDLRLS